MQDLREAGFLALNVPVCEGGFGADLSETVESLRRIAASSPSTALMLAMHTSILANYLLDPALVPADERSGFEEQRSWVWQQAVEGKIFAVANSEPGAGGDLHQSRSVVSGSRFTGLKSFASFGIHADYYMAAARHDHGGLDYFLVANDPNHVTVESPWNATGMRSSESVVLRLISAPVIGVLGYSGMLDGANNRHWSTLSFTAIFIGAAEGLLEEARRIATGMLQQTEAVSFHLTVQASLAFLRHCVSAGGATDRDLVRDCKTFVTRSLARDAAALFIAQSGRAYSFSSPFSRLFRDLLAGPALRPPLSAAFTEIWEELASTR